MEAMILAAGAGTRLRPLTDTVPKALVEVGGRPLLGRLLERLRNAGATRIIVNIHHHEDQISAFVEARAPGGVEIVLSPEPGGPYDTGGGLMAAGPLFQESDPFLLHNVDVLSDIPLGALLEGHRVGSVEGGRPVAKSVSGMGLVASLAVQEREARRRLLFDDQGLLGWENQGSDRAREGRRVVRDPVGRARALSFTGIHVVEPRIFELCRRTGIFSIIDLYLELAGEGFVIRPLDVSEHRWLDVGTPERLARAEEMMRERDGDGIGEGRGEGG